jgi:hypothetical protein
MIALALLLAAAPTCTAPLPAAAERHQALSAQFESDEGIPPHLQLRIDDALRRLGKVIERRRSRCAALDAAAADHAACLAADAGPCERAPVKPDAYATEAHLSWALAVAERGVVQLDLEAPKKGARRTAAPQILYPFTRGGRVGFFNTRGEIRIAPRFQAYAGTDWARVDDVWPPTSPWARVKLNNTWRYTDGARELKPPGQSLGAFSDGLAAVGSGGVWLYIDTDGRAAFDKTFLRADPFSEGKAVVGNRRGVFFITLEGTPAFAGVFLDAGRFSGGRAPVQTSAGWQFIDDRGEPLFGGALYDSAAPFAEGRARVGVDDGYGFLDDAGRLVVRGPYRGAGAFHGGAAAVTDATGAFHIGPDGRALYAARFEATGPFVDGLAQAHQDGRAGVIDRQGRWVVKPRFVHAVVHPRGVIRVADDQGERFIDWSGRGLPVRPPRR